MLDGKSEESIIFEELNKNVDEQLLNEEFEMFDY